MITEVKVGDLGLRLQTSRKLFNRTLSASFTKFKLLSDLDLKPGECGQISYPKLKLTESRRTIVPAFRERLLNSETWELWKDDQSAYTLLIKHYKEPFLFIRVDQNFAEGLYQWANPDIDPVNISINDILDLRLYLNWLANFGDLVLHASGFVYGGKGYCFLGESGRGKSTIVRDLVRQPGVIVLGEDQVILRYLDHNFYIYGTPWHTDPHMCAPINAPLEKMFFLDRARPQTVREMTPMEVTSRVLQTAFMPWYRRECLPLILHRVSMLPEHVRCVTLAYKLGRDGLETILSA